MSFKLAALARPEAPALLVMFTSDNLGARDDHERGAVASLRRSGQCTVSQRSVIRGGYDRLMRQLKCPLSGDTNSSVGDVHPGVRRLDCRDGALGATACMGPLLPDWRCNWWPALRSPSVSILMFSTMSREHG